MDKAERLARSGDKEGIAKAEILRRCRDQLNTGKTRGGALEFSPEEKKILRPLGLDHGQRRFCISPTWMKQILSARDRWYKSAERSRRRQKVAQLSQFLCGKLEAELSELAENDRKEMLESLGLTEPALATLAREAYKLLGLHSFFTAGPKEVRAWQIPVGATAPQAAGAIHTDFERGFIRAEIYTLADLRQYKTESAIKAAGKMRAEGKAYIMHDGDITHFLFNV